VESGRKFSCYIIGDGSLLIACGEQIIDSGNDLCGIISSYPAVWEWAADKGIPCFDHSNDYQEFLRRQPFDYLFSVGYLDKIPTELLALPRKMAINFHDALLPEYAGIHATTWALINREKRHGVTWHEMVAEIDKGRILKQKIVEIAENETAFSLNLKCYEAGLDTFTELLGELSNDNYTLTCQDINRRTYYGKYRRPPFGCILSWKYRAEEMVAMVRALNFGQYQDEIGLVKLMVKDDYIIIGNLNITEMKSDYLPGTICAITDVAFRVATISNDIEIDTLMTIDGEILPVCKFIKKYDLKLGDCLPEIDSETGTRITVIYDAISRYEAYWVDKLSSIHPESLGFTQNSNDKCTNHYTYSTVDIPIPEEFSHYVKKQKYSKFTYSLGAVSTYLCKAWATNSLCASIRYKELRKELKGLENFFAAHVPIVLEINSCHNFKKVCDIADEELEAIKNCKTYSRDLVVRYPQLNEKFAAQGKRQLPLMIEQVEYLKNYSPAVGEESCLKLIIPDRGNNWRMFFREDVLTKEQALMNSKRIEAFLKRVIAMPETPLEQIVALTDEEIKTLVYERNNTAVDYPKDKCIHELFARQVNQYPKNIAAIYEDKTITYRDLNEKASRLAAFLNRNGVGRGSLIGIFIERSLDMLVGLLGILKAGGAYVPIDPIYPPDRILHMIEDASLSLILTQEQNEHKLPQSTVKKLCLDRDWPEINKDIGEGMSNQPYTYSNKDVGPDDPAYVIFTSGSTGKPKGVEIVHRGLTNFLCSMAENPGFTKDDRILALTTICFDIAGLELYLPLITGGQVEILPTETARDGVKLKEKLESGGATVVQATPATWEMLLAVNWNQKLPIKILCGGEALSPELAEQLLERSNEVWNMYGPTETTIWSAVSRVKPDDKITVGWPIANTQFYILDEHLNPVPDGTAGELFIGGDGLANGYLHRPDLTKEKFIPSPFSTESQLKIYRTGDAAQYLPDGQVICLGRVDNQVKLRGFRIELGEIESVLQKQPQVKRAVVVVKQDDTGYKSLVAFVVSDGSTGFEASDKLNEAIRKFLPDYMLPNSYVYMAALPLTLNLKVDRKLLESLPMTQIVETYGYKEATRNGAADQRYQLSQSDTAASDSQNVGKDLKEQLVQDIVGIVAGMVKVPDGEIDAAVPMGYYGFDSLRFTMLGKRIKDEFGITITPVQFYNYSTINKLADYILGEHKEKLQQYYPTAGEETKPVAGNDIYQQQVQVIDIVNKPSMDFIENPKQSKREPVAIIGMSGVFPQSPNIESFWENIENGKDMITQIPHERWNADSNFISEMEKEGMTYSKWGGFLEDIDKFDAAFFNISPREAEQMDPQQRIFLEIAWKAIEDAGYKPSDLSGTKAGVYVGSISSDYWDMMASTGLGADAYTISGNINCIIANRISYLLNLRGASAAINTACSSSLVAIHKAVIEIQNGYCDLAIAGGVNVILNPFMHIALGANGMLSDDGRCKTFDSRANGYVRSEGAGAVILKPLSQAVADGDHIYALIRGSMENHGGRTNSLTAPSSDGQADLLTNAYCEAGIDPSTVTYIETHGTGTSLGDPIEINGIKQAFTQLYQTWKLPPKLKHCGLGSVKANMGHLEASAGIAGLIKVILAMNKGMLPGQLHFSEQNPYIDLEGSPFYIVSKTKEWDRLTDNEGNVIPRRAGVSSFGFGGSNAHVVIEEYIPPVVERPSTAITAQSPVIIVLSAINAERLKEQVKQLLAAIGERQFSDFDLAAIAYTLQVGRESMVERLGLIVRSIGELEQKLQNFIENQENIPELYRGRVNRKKDPLAVLTADEDMTSVIDTWISKRKYTKLLDLWVNGLDFDWSKLYGNSKPQRTSLPTYPFAKERHWVFKDGISFTNKAAATLSNAGTIHPLLQQNTSDFYEQRFSSTFTGHEFFLRDHVVRNQRVLPGVVYLEMAREAVGQATGALKTGHIGIQLKDVVWIQPIVVEDQPVEVHIGLFPEDNGQIAYEIYSKSAASEAETIIHSQGTAILSRLTEVPVLDLKALESQCNQKTLSASQCYVAYQELGFAYGPAHQGLAKVYAGSGQVLAKLCLPAPILDTKDQFVLHPSLLDAALQALIGLVMDSEDLKTFLPFALQELEIFAGCTAEMWALIGYSKGSAAGDRVPKFDIDLCDEQGAVCVRIKGFSTRVLAKELGLDAASKTHGMLMLVPSWQEQAAVFSAPGSSYSEHLVVLCEASEVLRESIEKGLSVRCLTLKSEQKDIGERFQSYVAQVFEEIQSSLKEKPIGKVLVQVVVPSQGEQQLFSGLSGLLKTAQLENPKLIGQLIEVDIAEDTVGIIEKLKENSLSPFDSWIRYQEGKRLVAGWSETDVLPVAMKIPWKDRGIYLISGGAGGLGLIFAREIVKKVKNATLILTGRSELNEAQQATLKELEALNSRIVYKQVDVTGRTAVESLIQNIQEEFGSLQGIIHSAGLIRDNYILKKTREELQEVLAPKVTGLVNLDQASQDLDLDFFILFSSISGSLGNPGQADYAAANAFMDIYAKYRNMLVAAKQRQGQTLSINWPLWQEGGMHIDAEIEKIQKQNIGMVVMRTANGIKALYQGLALGKHQVLVLEGDLKRLRTVFLEQSTAKEALMTLSNAQENKSVPVIGQDILQEKTANYFKRLLASTIKLPAQQIEADVPLEIYGIDSIMVIQLTNQLEKTFGSLSKTLFFEYQTIQELIGYFLTSYHDQLVGLLGIEEKAAATNEHSPTAQAAAEQVKAFVNNRRRSRFTSLRLEELQEKAGVLDIAIIGVSGRYPGARNVQEFWQNLRDGKDCITEIPSDRWDHSLYFDEDKDKPGKTYSKWGGFMEGVDQFDPLFFNISPREAELMDPQERLFLECVFETLEDAGYTRKTLGSYCGSGLAGNVGVYVGAMYEEYQLYGAQEQILGRPIALSGNPASIANRVSYFCNFHGPSMAVDTMCSSSLTAIHLACQSLQRGGCELAIAGGVNVSIHPNKYLFLAQGKFVSSKGRCESFGQGGDGYVPGEGVGAVLLKPLSKAIADGDHIYGIVKATAVNHGGKTNGYTVPNPNAQANVIGQALKDAGINPRSISYIEAHGTGTSLGDPIEIAGLMKAFQDYTNDKQFCAIGSAKSNIGHCESAAGIAGITKVLLQLKHRQLVPSLHSEILNPNIDFSNTSFVVQHELAEWKQPVVEINGERRPYSRIAGISSFGAGGSNAHVVIEEYIAQNTEQIKIATMPLNPAIIVLSARNEVQLQEQALRLLAAINEQQFSDRNLTDMAYTLQMGREAMEERLALIVKSTQELEEKLKGFVKKQDGIEDIYRGQVKRNKETLGVFTSDEDLQGAIDTWITKGKYDKLADFWVKGLVIDWNKLYGEVKPHRISLPTYPFARERCWIPENGVSALSQIISSGSTPFIHPLLQQNTSDLSEQRFSSTFTGQEFFLADHVVKGQRLLPGVAYLEMARAAVEKAVGVMEGHMAIRLKNIVWTRPVAIEEEPVQVHIEIYPEDNGEIAYEIYGKIPTESKEPVMYSQGSAVLGEVTKASVLDLTVLQAECGQDMFSSAECYDTFRALGFDYGPGHQGLEQVYVGHGQVLAKLSLPSAVADTREQFILHPSMMDAALQASLLIRPGDCKLAIPFALQDLEIVSKCTSSMWALVRYTKGSSYGDMIQKFDIDLCDEQGNVCVRMKGFSARVLEGNFNMVKSAESIGMLMLEPCWEKELVVCKAVAPDCGQHLVILCEMDDISPADINAVMNEARCLNLQSPGEIEERFKIYAVQVFEEIQNILKDKPKAQVLVQIVVSTLNEPQLCGLLGLLKTARLENSRLMGQLIVVDRGQSAETIIEQLKENSRSPLDQQIRYENGRRFVARWSNIEAANTVMKIPWKEHGVYLITGGAGGLGLVFAREIADNVKEAVLILTGRSSLDETRQAKLKEMESSGTQIIYRQVDVTDREASAGLIQDILHKFGKLDGIIHAAGMLRDSLIVKKSKEEFLAVLAPKVAGLVNLDEASQDLELDFFVFFSSIAGALGNLGQADYATANAFMDGYARYRNNLVASKERHGSTLSINWPLWKEGGMHVDQETEKMMQQNMGMIAMRTPTGIQAFYQALASGKDQVTVVEGNAVHMKQKMFSRVSASVLQPVNTTPLASTIKAEIDSGSLADKVKIALIQMVSELLKVKAEDIDADTVLNDYGFDSISLTAFGNKLNREYKLELTPAIFFEYPTLQGFVEYLIAEHKAAFAGIFTVQTVTMAPVQVREGETKEIPAGKVRNSRLARPVVLPAARRDTGALEPVAIVGISGRFPMARDVNEFWKNLTEGKDCITEIPKDRWDWREYYGDPGKEKNKTNIKWGGFIDGVAEFDPLFFGISPREAQLMDPQQRLLMTYVWQVLEDAGYSAQSLSGSNTGIFVGTTNCGYNGLISKAKVAIEGYSSTGMVPSVGPNRMSYFLNLHGPSEPIETACSSSLVAIRRAVCAIENGSCEMAIAGGVNTIVNPELHISFNKAGMLSEDGRCKTFSDKANGYVRGEGVGMLLLKRLKDAERDGDHIYGVIRGTAENHGGRANSLTAPNPKAQTELLKTAYSKAGIDPRTVTYIEAHGTGTELGDPIEITGLKTAFKDLYQAAGDSQVVSSHCGLGSVKTNIGHLELAAGIAGVIKVLLQLKHKTLVKSLHCDTMNPYIQLKDTPFYIVQETKKWEALKDDHGKDLPRRAGVSSFGFGGVNSHVVIEEYIPKDLERTPILVTGNPSIIVLSAKNEKQLREQAGQLLTAIREQQFTDDDLTDMAYTLQVGREAMDERLAVIAASHKELEDKLQGFLDGRDGIPDLYRGCDKRGKENLPIFKMDEDLQNAVEAWIDKGKYANFLSLWVKGLSFEWNRLYLGTRPRRISLPTYPFTKERYWLPETQSVKIAAAIPAHTSSISYLAHQNNAKSAEPVLDSKRFELKIVLPQPLEQSDTAPKSSITIKPNRISLQSPSEVANPNDQPEHHGEPIAASLTADISLASVISNKPASTQTMASPLQALQEELANSLADALYVKRGDIGLDKLFSEMGLDSIIGTEWIREVNARYKTSISTARIYEYPTIREFTQYMASELNVLEGGLDLQSIASEKDDISKQNIISLASVISNKPASTQTMASPLQALQEELANSLADALYVKRGDIGLDKLFSEMGLDSIIGTEWIREVNARYKTSISTARIYEYPTIREFTQYMASELNVLEGGLDLQSIASEKDDISKQNIISLASVISNKPASTQTMVSPLQALQEELANSLADALYMERGDIGVDKLFSEMGLDSIIGTEWVREVNARYKISISTARIYEYPTIREFTQYMVSELNVLEGGSDLQSIAPEKNDISKQDIHQKIPDHSILDPDRNPYYLESQGSCLDQNEQKADDIAIIGVSGRYPLSNTLGALWDNLKAGHNCITQVPARRWNASLTQSLSREKLQRQSGKHYGGFLENIDRFDHYLFAIDRDRVMELSPETRLFVEIVWETFEDAGYNKLALQDLQTRHQRGVGVFVGTMYNQYSWNLPSMELAVLNSNLTDWQIANRTSHFFDLTGLSLTVNSACSSSLTAIHLACESLKQKTCSMAIVGGVNLTLDPSKYDVLRKIRYLGSGNLSKSFGAGDGFIPAEGVGAVLLKPLSLAIKDNDRIDAVIKSSFANHSGGRQTYTVPDPRQQTELILNSLQRAGIDPSTISYVESAANGSELGDPIEVIAMSNAFRKFTDRKQYCALGSVKSNLGHLEAASGIAQLTKVLLQFKHKTLVPTINADPRNPNIRLEDTAFYLQEKTNSWNRLKDQAGEDIPRRSMINSFGAGGAYANLIVEEFLGDQFIKAPDKPIAQEYLMVFSTKTTWSLMKYLEQIQDFLANNPSIALGDMAHTLHKINHHLEHRAALLASSSQELIEKLNLLRETNKTLEDSGIYISLDQESKTACLDASSIQQDLVNKDLRQLARYWVTGAVIDFRQLVEDTETSWVDLPKYAFDHNVKFDFSQDKSALNSETAEFADEYSLDIVKRIFQGELSENQFKDLMR
jgi:amino acid adenylation domain-containing protein